MPSLRNLRYLVAAALLANSACNRVSDPGTPPDSRRLGRIYLPDGLPAGGAKVMLFHARYLPESPEGSLEPITVIADAQGRFDAGPVPEGFYNILAKSDSFSVLLDSVRIDSLAGANLSAVLGRPGSWQGRVLVPPQHQARRFLVSLPGTDRFTYLDSAGGFDFPGMAMGRYSARIGSDIPGYGTLHVTVRIEPGRQTVTDSLHPPFTGYLVPQPGFIRFHDALDLDSSLLVATDLGLMNIRKKDGTVEWTGPSSIGHATNEVLALAPDSGSGVWAGLAGGHVARYRNGFWSQPEELPFLGPVTWIRLRVDLSGGLWALVRDTSSGDSRILRRTESKWSQVPVHHFGPSYLDGTYRFLDLEIGTQGKPWVSFGGRLYGFNGDGWDSLGGPGTAPSGASLGSADQIAFAPDGTPWGLFFGRNKGWPLRHREGAWERVSIREPDFGSRVWLSRGLLATRDGAIWIGHNMGMTRIKDSVQTAFDFRGPVIPRKEGGVFAFQSEDVWAIQDSASRAFSLGGFRIGGDNYSAWP